MKNFTLSQEWRQALYMRYPHSKIYSTKNIDIVDRDDFFECKQLFDYYISEKDIAVLKKLLEKKDIKFKYIDKCSPTLSFLYKHLGSDFIIDEESNWNNPILNLKKNMLASYLSSRRENMQRNYKSYLKNKHLLIFKNNKTENILSLWKDVLEIDQNCWKEDEGSDMMSLEYEHLQYIFFCMKNPNNYFLNISYNEDEMPIGYSLLLKNENVYYAAKWGATTNGRKYYIRGYG